MIQKAIDLENSEASVVVCSSSMSTMEYNYVDLYGLVFRKTLEI